MVLAPLVWAGVTSAYASVFMLVYCSEVKKPKVKSSATTIHKGVAAPMLANSMIMKPSMTVFETSTAR